MITCKTKIKFTDYKNYMADGEIDSRPIQTYTKSLIDTIRYIIENTNYRPTLKNFITNLQYPSGITIEDDGVFYTVIEVLKDGNN